MKSTMRLWHILSQVTTNKSSFYDSGWACLGLDGKRSFFQGPLKSSYDVFKLIAKSGCCDYTRFLFPTFVLLFFPVSTHLSIQLVPNLDTAGGYCHCLSCVLLRIMVVKLRFDSWIRNPIFGIVNQKIH